MTKRIPTDFPVPLPPQMRAVAACAHALYGPQWMRPLAEVSGVSYSTIANAFARGVQLQDRHLSRIEAAILQDGWRIIGNAQKGMRGALAITGRARFEDVCEQPVEMPVPERVKTPRGRAKRSD